MSSKLARLQARIAELEAENARMRAWVGWQFGEDAVDATDTLSAVGGAPGVSETHTDPEEGQ